MKWNRFLEIRLNNRDEYLSNWHRWFAWYPVLVEDKWVWCEWIERKRYLWSEIDGCGYDYKKRFIKEHQHV